MDWGTNSETIDETPRGRLVAYVEVSHGDNVLVPPLPRESYGRPHLRPLAALADGPVADTPEPVTAQPVVTRTDSDGDDGDAVTHG